MGDSFFDKLRYKLSNFKLNREKSSFSSNNNFKTIPWKKIIIPIVAIIAIVAIICFSVSAYNAYLNRGKGQVVGLTLYKTTNTGFIYYLLHNNKLRIETGSAANEYSITSSDMKKVRKTISKYELLITNNEPFDTDTIQLHIIFNNPSEYDYITYSNRDDNIVTLSSELITLFESFVN